VLVKTLSVWNPWAAYICAGIKTVENRDWSTDYRGRLLIHASKQGKDFLGPHYNQLPPSWQAEVEKCHADPSLYDDADPVLENTFKYCAFLRVANDFYGDGDFKAALKEKGAFMPACAIIGECELVDVVGKKPDDDWAEDGWKFYWILGNAKLYGKPIKNVLGKLKLWDFDMTGIDYVKPQSVIV
jgi:hypothetical protein